MSAEDQPKCARNTTTEGGTPTPRPMGNQEAIPIWDLIFQITTNLLLVAMGSP